MLPTFASRGSFVPLLSICYVNWIKKTMSAYDFCTDKARSFDVFRQFRYVLRFAV